MTGELESGPLEETLAGTRVAFVAALARADVDALAELYTADATLLPPAAEAISGRAAIGRYWEAGLDAGIVAVRLEATTLVHDVRLACELGSYELRLEPPAADAIVERGGYLLVHSRLEDGSWRRRVEIFTPARVHA